MNKINKNQFRNKYQFSNKATNHNNISSFEDNAQKDIEKLIYLEDIHGTEAYFSNRYGWTLRKIIR